MKRNLNRSQTMDFQLVLVCVVMSYAIGEIIAFKVNAQSLFSSRKWERHNEENSWATDFG